MAKFIIDTDVLAENAQLYLTEEKRTMYILNTLRAAHKGVIIAPWLTPCQEKKKRGMDGAGPYSYLFEAFWSDYPARNGSKQGKRQAFKAWVKLFTTSEQEGVLYGQCKRALEWQCRQEEWVKDKGSYIPMAATWLNGERWTDERPEGMKEARTFTDMNGASQSE